MRLEIRSTLCFYAFLAILFTTPQLNGLPVSTRESSNLHSLYDSCVTLRGEGRFDEAIQGQIKVRELAKKSKDRPLELLSLEQLGFLYWNTGELQESARCFEEGRILSKTLADEISLETCTTALRIYDEYNNGKKYRNTREYAEAIKAFESAITLARSIKSQDHEVKCLRQTSLIYFDTGNLKEFYSINEEALQVARRIHHKAEEARCMNNIGIYFWKIIDYSKALNNFKNSLSIMELLKKKAEQAEIIHNIGLIYSDLGEYDNALEYLSNSLNINREIANSINILKNLIVIGITYRRMAISSDNKDYFSKALDIYFQTLETLKSLKDERTEIRVLNSIGNIYTDQEKYPDALEYFRKALAKAETVKDEEAVGMILNNIGIVYASLGQYEVSTTYFQRAIDRGLEISGGQILWEAYLEIANVYQKQGETERAIINYKNSIAVIEDIRSQIKLEELKASFLATDKRLESYLNLIDILAERGLKGKDPSSIEEAFQYLEKAKARAFLDSLEISEIPLSQGVDARLLNQEREIMGDVSRLYTRLLTAGLTADEKSEIALRIKDLEKRLEGLKTEIRAASPAYAGLKYPRIATLAEARRLLNRRTICLSYALGKVRSWGFALTRKTLKVFLLPSKKDLQKKVSDYLKVITDKDARGFAMGQELYDMLVAPGLDTIPDHLIVVPDDVLFLLPFEALATDASGPHWLIERARISYAPSLSSLRELVQIRKGRRRGWTKDLLAFGDPDFKLEETPVDAAANPQPFLDIFPSLPFQIGPLRYSRFEVQGIASSFKPKRTTIYMGREATKDILKSLPLSDYRILHFATHSLIDDVKPARSSILLTLDRDPAEDGLLQMREIINLSLRADLVTLSGCRTGLGQFIRGEGIDNLSRAFFYAGASSVLMSLWAVDDEASSHLMARFYAYLRSARSVEDALRRAQLEMIGSREASHPYFWAGFIVTGTADQVLFRHSWLIWTVFVVLAAAAVVTFRKTLRKTRVPRS